MVSNSSTLFLRFIVLVLGAIVLGLCVAVLPLGIMSDNTGYYRWLLAGLYLPALPFFYALYKTMLLLRLIDSDMAFSEMSVGSLRSIKHCGALIAGLFTLGMPYIFYVADLDNAPGVVLIGLVIIGASIVVAVFAAVLQKLLHSALEIKSENDMTV